MSAEPTFFDDPGDEAYEPDRFHVDSDDTAAWALRKIAGHEQHLADIDEQASRHRHRIDQWQQRESHAAKRSIGYLTNLLVQYARDQRGAGRKTIDTPYGKVTTRPRQATVDYDEKALTEWLQAEGRSDLLKVTVSRSAVKQAVLKDGEALEGVTVDRPDPDDCTVQVRADAP